jgi:hypothetical protein
VPATSGKEVDDAAFDHICSKLASRFIPYITSHGILKYALQAELSFDGCCVIDIEAKISSDA